MREFQAVPSGGGAYLLYNLRCPILAQATHYCPWSVSRAIDASGKHVEESITLDQRWHPVRLSNENNEDCLKSLSIYMKPASDAPIDLGVLTINCFLAIGDRETATILLPEGEKPQICDFSERGTPVKLSLDRTTPGKFLLKSIMNGGLVLALDYGGGQSMPGLFVGNSGIAFSADHLGNAGIRVTAAKPKSIVPATFELKDLHLTSTPARKR